jgi:hypothetical protein
MSSFFEDSFVLLKSLRSSKSSVFLNSCESSFSLIDRSCSYWLKWQRIFTSLRLDGVLICIDELFFHLAIFSNSWRLFRIFEIGELLAIFVFRIIKSRKWRERCFFVFRRLLWSQFPFQLIVNKVTETLVHRVFVSIEVIELHVSPTINFEIL